MAIIFRYGSPGAQPGIIVAGGFEKDCEAYRHTLLKEAIRDAGMDPEKASFSRHESGQPFVKYASESYAVSLSHTGEFVVMAFSLSGRIGIDAEKSERKVSDRLRKRIISHPDEEQMPMLKLWTIKEAFLKMTGTGLRFPMNKVKVEVNPHPGGENENFKCFAEIAGNSIRARAVSFLYGEYRVTFCFEG